MLAAQTALTNAKKELASVQGTLLSCCLVVLHALSLYSGNALQTVSHGRWCRTHRERSQLRNHISICCEYIHTLEMFLCSSVINQEFSATQISTLKRLTNRKTAGTKSFSLLPLFSLSITRVVAGDIGCPRQATSGGTRASEHGWRTRLSACGTNYSV